MNARLPAAIVAACWLVGCAVPGSYTGPYSESWIDESQVAGLPAGIDRDELIRRLGPPAQSAGYPRLNETVLSWRLIEPGNDHFMFNAHLDPNGHVKGYSRSLDPATLGGSRRG